jgi:nicotinate phosphoribosyltransferase
VRLDSGDLADLAIRARQILDDGGLRDVEIFASGSLDEYEITELLERGAPIAGFGVGTRMGVPPDAPALDVVYKLTEYRGEARTKLSPGKGALPGRKQVFRIEEDGRAARDIIARHDERHPGRPLLRKVMEGGRRLPDDGTELGAARERARLEIAKLPDRLQEIRPADPPYPVEVSEALSAQQQAIAARHYRW